MGVSLGFLRTSLDRINSVGIGSLLPALTVITHAAISNGSLRDRSVTKVIGSPTNRAGYGSLTRKVPRKTGHGLLIKLVDFRVVKSRRCI